MPDLKPACILAFDFGTQRIGVAIGQTITRTASPLAAIPAKDGIPRWETIGALIDEWHPQQLLIGLPLNMDGSESNMSLRAEKFARRLHGRFGLPVQLWDERLSSFEARGELLARGKCNFKQNGVDSLSACVILEGWFAANY